MKNVLLFFLGISFVFSTGCISEDSSSLVDDTQNEQELITETDPAHEDSPQNEDDFIPDYDQMPSEQDKPDIDSGEKNDQDIPDVSGEVVIDYENRDKFSAGFYHSCFIKNAELYCTGLNTYGQLGSGDSTSTNYPKKLASSDWRNVSASTRGGDTGKSHTCAIKQDNSLYCWGMNEHGELGNGATESSQTPVEVFGNMKWKHVSCGTLHTCAISDKHELYCWGNAELGRLGFEDTSQIENRDGCGIYDGFAYCSKPQKINDDTDWVLASAGNLESCGLKRNGDAYCFGNNDFGQLGMGSVTDLNDIFATPVKVSGGHFFIDLFSAGSHVCAVTGSHDLYCWGWNEHGGLGIGIAGDGKLGTIDSYRSAPQLVNGNLKWKKVSLGMWHSCGITTSDTLFCFGDNRYGSLGIGISGGNQPNPSKVPGISDVAEVAAGGYHTIFKTKDGSFYSFGDNTKGQLGNSNNNQQDSPVKLNF